MWTFLGLMSMLGIVTFIVTSLVSLVRKTGNTKKYLKYAGISFVVFILAISMDSSKPPTTASMSESYKKGFEAGQKAAIEKQSTPEKKTSEPPHKETSKPQPKLSETQPPIPVKPFSSSNASVNQPKITEKNVPESEPKNTVPNYISGLTAADIKINLENVFKFDFTGPQSSTTGYHESGEVVDPETGAELTCDFYADTPSEIKLVEFTIIGPNLSMAKYFLSYSATLPYDNAEPAKAKAWVEANISKANKEGRIISATFGGVKYKLYGNKNLRILEIGSL